MSLSFSIPPTTPTQVPLGPSNASAPPSVQSSPLVPLVAPSQAPPKINIAENPASYDTIQKLMEDVVKAKGNESAWQVCRDKIMGLTRPENLTSENTLKQAIEHNKTLEMRLKILEGQLIDKEEKAHPTQQTEKEEPQKKFDNLLLQYTSATQERKQKTAELEAENKRLEGEKTKLFQALSTKNQESERVKSENTQLEATLQALGQQLTGASKSLQELSKTNEKLALQNRSLLADRESLKRQLQDFRVAFPDIGAKRSKS